VLLFEKPLCRVARRFIAPPLAEENDKKTVDEGREDKIGTPLSSSLFRWSRKDGEFDGGYPYP
jgi:hypothetical protein